MKTILAFGLTAALFSVSPAFADGSTNPLCGPDAPDSYKRPGGYCEQISGSGSLSGPVSPTAEEEAGGGPPLVIHEAV